MVIRCYFSHIPFLQAFSSVQVVPSFARSAIHTKLAEVATQLVPSAHPPRDSSIRFATWMALCIFVSNYGDMVMEHTSIGVVTFIWISSFLTHHTSVCMPW